MYVFIVFKNVLFVIGVHTWETDEKEKALGALEWIMAVNNNPSWNLCEILIETFN